MGSCCQYPSASYFRVLRCVVLPRSSRTKFHTVRRFRLFREVLLQDYVFCQDRTFCDCDVEWDQPKEYPSYLLLLQNENETSTKITVRYSQRQPPHTFDVPPESTRAFLVDDSQPGAHVISFSSSNGSLAGTVRVLLSNA